MPSRVTSSAGLFLQKGLCEYANEMVNLSLHVAVLQGNVNMHVYVVVGGFANPFGTLISEE